MVLEPGWLDDAVYAEWAYREALLRQAISLQAPGMMHRLFRVRSDPSGPWPASYTADGWATWGDPERTPAAVIESLRRHGEGPES